MSPDIQSERLGHSETPFCCALDNFHNVDKSFTLEVGLMSFPLPLGLANHSDAAFIRSSSSHESANTKSDRLVLSSSATAVSDDF